jgi:hypothetical protein
MVSIAVALLCGENQRFPFAIKTYSFRNGIELKEIVRTSPISEEERKI